MKLLNIPVGLIINFHELKVTDGVFRMILPGANQEVTAQTEGNKGNEEFISL